MNASNQPPPITYTYLFKNVRAVFVAAQANAKWEQTCVLQMKGSTAGSNTFTGKGENKPMWISKNINSVITFETNSGDVGDIEIEMTFTSSQGNSTAKLISSTKDTGAGNLHVVYYGSEDHGGTDFNDTLLTMIGING